MSEFNEKLAKAGVMLAGEGLQASSKGCRLRFDDAGKRTVTYGPFTESKELIAGFWIIQAKSLEEAVEWARRAPNPHWGEDTHIEVRQVFSADDFGDALTPELREQEQRLREQSGANLGA